MLCYVPLPATCCSDCPAGFFTCISERLTCPSALKSQTTHAGSAMPICPGRSTCHKEHTNAASMTAQHMALNSEHHSNSDSNYLSMEDGSPSLDDFLRLQDCSTLFLAVGTVPFPADMPFSNSQLHVLQQTVQAAVQSACFQQEHTNKYHYSSPPVHPTGIALPLGLQQPG